MKKILALSLLSLAVIVLTAFFGSRRAVAQQDMQEPKNKPNLAEPKEKPTPAPNAEKSAPSDEKSAPVGKTKMPPDTKAIDVRQLYLNRCATCHGNDGRARTFKGRLRGAQDLTDKDWQDSTNETRIADIISIGKGSRMPAFARKMSADEIAALAGYVRQLAK